MGCSTFSNFTVLPEIAVAKIRAGRAVRQGLLHRLRRHHRRRRGDQHRQGRAGRQRASCSASAASASTSSRALRLVGADMIIGVDLNPARKAWGERFGMTHFVNPKEVDGDLVAPSPGRR